MGYCVSTLEMCLECIMGEVPFDQDQDEESIEQHDDSDTEIHLTANNINDSEIASYVEETKKVYDSILDEI